MIDLNIKIKHSAMKMLKSRLYELELEKQKQQKDGVEKVKWMGTSN